MRQQLLALILIAIISQSFASSVHASPAIAEEAPSLGPIGWIGDEPPSYPTHEKSGEYIFVVEMFASWNRESTQSLELLKAIAEQHSKAKVLVLAISNEELETVGPIAEQLKIPGLHFGLDVDVVATNNFADDVDIPVLYVIGQDGKIAWKGNPIATPDPMNETILKLTEGTFDMESATNAELRERKYAALQQELQAAYQQDKEDDVFRILDEMIKTKPDFLHPYLIKRQAIVGFGAYQRLPAHMSILERRFSKSSADLMQLINVEMSLDLGDRNPRFLMRCAEKLLELTERKDPDAYQIAAGVYAEVGLYDRAIDALDKAADLVTDGALIPPIEKKISYYKTLKKIQKENPEATKKVETEASS